MGYVYNATKKLMATALTGNLEAKRKKGRPAAGASR